MANVRWQPWLVAALAVAWSDAAQAQPVPDPPAAPAALAGLEVTPHVSFDTDDASGIGAAIGLRIRPKLLVELDAEARLGNPERLQRLHANVVWDLRAGRVTPFLIAGAGYETYRGAHHVPAVGSFGWTSSGLAAVVGGGVRIPLGGRWTLRSDVRWSAGVSDGVPNRVRIFQGVGITLPRH